MNAAVPDPSPAVRAAVTLATAPLTPFDGQLAYLPLDWIDVQPGFNPRTFFEDGEFAALVESVKVQGILQAIWVRPHERYDPGRPRFWLIAGERRLRAAHAAGLSCIPVTVRVADARQALILADLENNPALRINLSVAEEAQFAQRFLGECDGDRAEAARLLGWSRARLDARLLLLHAAPAVLEALKQRHIQVGHAELLAGLPEATQTGTLAKIVGDRITVADLKARIKGFALDLSAAIFDQTECATCPHHSSQQAALFAEAVEGGHCQNRACHHQKTQAALVARKTELETTYPSVFLDTERAPDRYAVLSESGPQGVGQRQFTACQGCRFFAACLSSQPGREGVLQAPLCINRDCHREKVAAAHPPAAAPSFAAGRATAAPATATPATRSTVPPKTPVAPVDAYPKQVEAWVDGWLRRQAALTATQQPDLLRAWLLLALFREAGQPCAVLAEVGLEVEPAPTRAALIPRLHGLDADRKQQLLIALTRHLIQQPPASGGGAPGPGEPAQAAVATLHAGAIDLAAAFVPDEGFWQAHTKAGLASLLHTARSPSGETFAEWYAREHRESATDTQAFARLMNGSRTALIAALVATRFDFSAWVPEVIARRFPARR
jgi:ParB family chromosome partitioning protein